MDGIREESVFLKSGNDLGQQGVQEGVESLELFEAIAGVWPAFQVPVFSAQQASHKTVTGRAHHDNIVRVRACIANSLNFAPPPIPDRG